MALTESIIDLLKNTVTITGFVMVMMLLIEYINVKSRGSFNQALMHRPHLQILLATFLGLIPGCLGTFTVVSLFTHRILSFGALVAALIASSGDEAFFMISLMPVQTVWMMIILAVTAVVFGYTVNFFVKGKLTGKFDGHFVLHDHDAHVPATGGLGILHHLRHLSLHRGLMLLSIGAFVAVMASGMLAHEHGPEIAGAAEHSEHGGHLGWMDYTFIAVSLFTLFVVATVSDHFLEDHLWKHILKKHFLRILLWTLGALAAAMLLKEYVHIPEANSYMLWGMLAMALLVGIIPESGPHMVFISLYLSGHIPLSILLANSIVQDGHGAIPLFAESPRGFFLAKDINVFAGAAVGATMLLLGF